ncbi:MAG: ATP-binding cassette domain-containing protein [Saprospiraceae bacterium]|nr:ATP-binding cassette domain-containing protein [Saprospiraceae bacterium]MBK8484710.1 ATP-binding cassette domain-containing protein [Saprospiraceae bacterium]MBK9222137.1 ATP-binding cassette domain-containing protein [Saprospiraceae bacterium]MBK9720953.1 ATP-binding cassette domain-containing protein [Saprospiraceae bacterium]MBK9727947.1 ATP-binding cassette domain-containing protein [Saprospiraceae bacterium]
MEVRIENLTKSYGIQKAVDSISFDIKSGEIVGFLGPNGAGKTTTMKILTQYMAPDSGTVWYDNKSSYDADIRREIGYLPEHNPLYEDMPVMDYLSFSASLQGVAESDLNTRVVEMVRLCGLDVEKHKKIGELSKGYRQRVGLAQAIIHNPKILILDEPTTGLDPNQIVEIRELIRKLGREKTVILSTHILPEVEATCDRILIINKGKIAADGTVQELRKQSEGKQILQVRIEGDSPEHIAEQLRKLDNIQNVLLLDRTRNRFEIQSIYGTETNRIIFHACKQSNWDLLEMIPFETKLEDIFRDLTIN